MSAHNLAGCLSLHRAWPVVFAAMLPCAVSMAGIPTRMEGLQFDQSLTAGSNALLEVQLQLLAPSGSDTPWVVLPNMPVNFQVMRSEEEGWQDVPDDGMEATHQATTPLKAVGGEGMARVFYYLDPKDFPPGVAMKRYKFRALFYGWPLAMEIGKIFEGCSVTSSVDVQSESGRLKPISLHREGQGVPLILVHGDNGEKIPDCRWRRMIDVIHAHPDDFKELDVYYWVHSTSKPIGFNGKCGSALDLANTMDKSLPGQKAILVGYSRGGLVCRAYMNEHSDRVLGVITLGTPNWGTPLTAPDWTAVNWVRFAPEAFLGARGAPYLDALYGFHGRVYKLGRLGSLQLAWAWRLNLRDPVLVERMEAVFSHDGKVYLSNTDMNLNEEVPEDLTRTYLQRYKDDFGTLAQMNAETFRPDSIVTYAAYSDQIGTRRYGLVSAKVKEQLDTAMKQLRPSLEAIDLPDFPYEHDFLQWAALFMGKGSDIDGANFWASDGYVPLQSALYLINPSGRGIAVRTDDGRVTVGQAELAEIERQRQVARHRIYCGATDGIKDHLDFLEAPLESPYWRDLTADIRSFLPKE